IVDTVGYNTLIISQNGYLFKETILIKEVQETSETTTILLPKTEEDAKKESNVVESYIPNFDVLKNDVYIDGSTTKYDGTTPITTFGLHKIVVKNVLDKGVGDYESEPYYIYIGLKDVQSGTFTEPQNLVTNAKTLKIESASGKYSKEYTNLEGNNTADINVIGDYIVTLIGVNGEKVVRNITLDAELEYNGNDLISTATLRNDNTKYVTQTSGVTLKKQANSTTDFKSITLNGNPIYTDINSNAGYTFNTIGNNKLAYSDIDGNVYTYDIIITEDEAVHLLVDGEYKPLQTTKASAEIIDYTSAKYVLDDKLKASSILLDGEAYNSTNISMFGLHDLTINGVNGYSKTYYTNIKFNNNIAKNYTEAVTLKDLVNVLSENPEDTSNFVNGKIVSVTSGNNTYGKTLDTVGTYTVVVNGYNGATETFDINLINNVVFKDLNNNVVEDSYTNVVKAVSANSLKYKSVKLNGSTYVFGSTINSLGKNKLVLTSTDGTETSQIITLTETLVNPVAYSTESQARETANRLNENDLIEVSFGQDLSYNMTLDGASYNGSDINGYGLHHVVLTGQDYTKDYYVMVNPYYEAKINETDDSIILTHNGKLTIGETDYSNVNALDTIGNYKNIKLTSNVSNDYVMEDDIVLDGILLGFENANTYNTSITPRLSLKASAIKVNGEIVDSLGSYNTVGSYTLEISGVNGYSKEYTFKLENEILADNNKLVNSYTSASIVSLSETGTVKYASYKLNNLSKDTLVSSVNSLGTNNLVVKDINGNETTYTIEITDESIRNSKLFDTRALALSNQLASLSLDKNNIDCTITVDGKPYNGEINTYGVHTVILSNENTGYTKSYSSFVELFSTIKEDAIYVNSTPTISLNSNYQIDGVSSNETKISSIGHHTITALGEGDVSTDIKFTVKEDLSGIEDNGIYTDKVTINISNIGSAAVGFDNGIMLANGASFSKIGKYTLQISGANDYTSSYSFTIKENEPIWNNKTYNISYTFNENDVEGLLIDDKKYSATFELVTVGYHNVRILGVGGYQSDEYKLTIKEDARNIINEQLNTYEHKTYGMQNFYDHQNEVTIAIPNAKIKLNNNPTEDTKVTLIGYYKLTVLGTNGYSNDYYFDIRYKLDGVEDGGTYIGSTSASADNVVMTLDGKIYTKGTPITSVGDHTLSVSGDGETTHFDYKFTIYPDFKDNEIINDYKIDTKVEYTSARSFNVQEGSGLLMEISDIDSLGNTSYKSYENGTVIDEIGEYTIIVYNPETGFKKTYSFEISADVEDIESEYTTSVTPVIKNKEVIKDITLNDEKYTIGTKIDFVGSYTLRINGKNNYQKVYNFTIKEDLNYITADISTVNKAVENYKKLDGDITSYSAVNIINNDESIKFNVTLNGKEITATNKFETINTLGYNKVIITGENGYRNEYNITLLETLNFEDNVIKEENSFIPSFGSLVSTGIVLDGAEYMGARVSGYGKHTITINGVNGYNKSYSINIPLVTEMHDKACYNSNVELSFNSNNIMVDNTSLENGSVLNSIGNHTVVVSGYGDISKTFNITILPELVGFKPDASYKSSDNIKASFKDSKAVSLALDGNNYQENTPITSYGTHTLVLTGTNDYKMVYEFKIELDTNIIDAALAFEFMPEANAKFSVDTTEWINGKPVEEVGNHTITYYGIVDADTVVKSITVEAQVNFENNSEVIGQVQLRIKNASKVLLNNNEVDANDIIDTIGANIITVVGTNSYTKDFNITITPQIKKIESLREDGRGINYIYQIIDKNNETTQTYLSFTIDGIDATNGGDYTRIGNHKVVIKGANNYVFEDEFTVEAQANVTEDAVYNTKTIVNMMDAQSMTIDGKTMTGDTVVANGKHVLVVTGDNGYVCEITFIYNNPHYLFVLIYVVVTLVIVLSAFAGRKIHKRRLIENGYVRKR
ncbi:MAG: hypothetical protein K6G28_01990, partial [Acholeplasmatales bacterium]|nr:hypothetical protein [Acholeplasmatales bacterium]